MSASPLFAALPGAVDSERGVLHFGELAGEQRALERGALVERVDRVVLRLTGNDRRSWLDSISSQALGGLAPGESAETLVLDPTGHIEFVLHVLADADALWLTVDAARAEAAAAWLGRMMFRLDVQLRVEPEIHVFALTAPELPSALEVLDQHGPIRSWLDPWPNVLPGGFGYAHELPDWHYRELLCSAEQAAALLELVHEGVVKPAGLLALDAARIEAGRPDAADLDEKSLPHEFDWLRTAVHLSKGCYRGQETVAKVFNLGRPPRRLVRLQLDGSESLLPEPGDEVWADKIIGEQREPRLIGRVTASARHAELGPIALALIKRAVPDEIEARVHHGGSEIPAAIEAIVPADAGPQLEVPRLPRLGIRP